MQLSLRKLEPGKIYLDFLWLKQNANHGWIALIITSLLSSPRSSCLSELSHRPAQPLYHLCFLSRSFKAPLWLNINNKNNSKLWTCLWFYLHPFTSAHKVPAMSQLFHGRTQTTPQTGWASPSFAAPLKWHWRSWFGSEPPGSNRSNRLSSGNSGSSLRGLFPCLSSTCPLTGSDLPEWHQAWPLTHPSKWFLSPFLTASEQAGAVGSKKGLHTCAQLGQPPLQTCSEMFPPCGYLTNKIPKESLYIVFASPPLLILFLSSLFIWVVQCLPTFTVLLISLLIALSA